MATAIQPLGSLLDQRSPSLALDPCEGPLYNLTHSFNSELETLPQQCQSFLPAGGISEAISSQPYSPPQRPSLSLKMYVSSLGNPVFVPTALRMTLIVGSLIFTINHREALIRNQMTPSRWISGLLSFVTPYMVSIYGQTQCQIKTDLAQDPQQDRGHDHESGWMR